MTKNQKPIIFSLSNSKKITTEICQKLKIKEGIIHTNRFADGEMLVQSKTSVRNRDVYIVQSTSKPVNENLMELLISIDSLKRSSAKTINVIIPYYGYARQDRKASGRQPITAKLVANLLEVAGATRIITFDFHAPQIQGFFDIPTDNLAGLAIISKEIKKDNIRNVVVVSPDLGGSERARKLANSLGSNIQVAIIDKSRIGKNIVKVLNVVGDVAGKNIIIIDDIIDTGNSIIEGANALLEKGTQDIYVVCVHPVFSNNAVKRLINVGIKKIYTTNSIELTKEKQHKKIQVISIAPFIADVINAIQTSSSISEIYKKYSRK